ncbi:pseudouridine synthase [bacterium]|nr:pseudouridine synthase [bacterium]
MRKPAPKRTVSNASNPDAESSAGGDRLHKVLAQAGVGSRRACELLILEGRVTVDGQVIRELGTKVDPSTAKISVDGQRIKPEPHVHYLVYKPKGYVSTSEDPSGRPLVLDLVPKARERIFIVGRLDRHSEGLMLLTNDGALAQRLTHPSYGVEKTYRVTVAGDAGQEIVDKLTEGVWLAEGKVRARRARIVAHRGNVTVLEVVLAEGKNREIRRMLARLEHKVLSLLRIAIGPLQLKGLSEGNWRTLTEAEVERLRTSTTAEDTEEVRPRKAPGRPGPRPRGEDRPAPRIRAEGDRPGPRKPGRYLREDEGRDSAKSGPRKPGRFVRSEEGRDSEKSGPRKPGRYVRSEEGRDSENSGPRKPGRFGRSEEGRDSENSGPRKPGRYVRSEESRDSENSGPRKPGRFGRDAERPARSRPGAESGPARPAARRRPEPAPRMDEQEEIVFTDRMDLDDRPARPEPRGDARGPRGDRPPRPANREGRPAARTGGKPGGKARPGISREDRPDKPNRTVMGTSGEPGTASPKRRGGPSRSLPPRRRRPKG